MTAPVDTDVLRGLVLDVVRKRDTWMHASNSRRANEGDAGSSIAFRALIEAEGVLNAYCIEHDPAACAAAVVYGVNDLAAGALAKMARSWTIAPVERQSVLEEATEALVLAGRRGLVEWAKATAGQDAAVRS